MKAVIFDMDGVLIDSEPMHLKVENMMLDRLGIDAPENYLKQFVGWTNPAMWKKIRSDYKVKESIEELIDIQMEMKLNYLNENDYEPIDGVIDLLDELQEKQVKIGLASSSPVEFIDAVLKKLKIEEYFLKWQSGENVENSKPAPDVFFEVAKLIEEDTKDCIVVEDSKSGTIAAKSAGMKCVGFQNINSGNQDLSEADTIVDSMTMIDYEFLKDLFKNN